jgi:flagellar basal body-associated protein FliL
MNKRNIILITAVSLSIIGIGFSISWNIKRKKEAEALKQSVDDLFQQYGKIQN